MTGDYPGDEAVERVVVVRMLSPTTTLGEAMDILDALGIDDLRIERSGGVVHCTAGGQHTTAGDLYTALGALVDIHRAAPVLRAIAPLCADVAALTGTEIKVRKVMFAGETPLVTVEFSGGRRSTFRWNDEDLDVIRTHLATF